MKGPCRPLMKCWNNLRPVSWNTSWAQRTVTANGIGLSSYGDRMVKQLLDYTGSLRPVRWVVGWTEFMKLIISTVTPVTIEQKTLR